MVDGCATAAGETRAAILRLRQISNQSEFWPQKAQKLAVLPALLSGAPIGASHGLHAFGFLAPFCGHMLRVGFRSHLFFASPGRRKWGVTGGTGHVSPHPRNAGVKKAGAWSGRPLSGEGLSTWKSEGADARSGPTTISGGRAGGRCGRRRRRSCPRAARCGGVGCTSRYDRCGSANRS